MLTTIPVGGTQFGGAAFDPSVDEVFLASNNSVSVITDSNNSVVASIPVGHDPSFIAYDSIRSELLVANYDSNSVSIISDSNDSVIATLQVGYSPTGVTYDSGVGDFFVANTGSNSLSVISDNSNTVVATLAVGEMPSGVAYDPAKNEVFVANGNDGTISVISDTAASSTLPSPSVPEFPALAILPLFATIILLSIVFIRKRTTKK